MQKEADTTLSPSLEDYLEAILLAVRKSRVARVRDIAKRLNVGMSAVTAALKALAKQELINYEPYQFITLTDRGREVANEISSRHRVLREFFTDVLGLDDETAEANACRMEHAADEALLDRLGLFAEFVNHCPRAGDDWVKAFQRYCAEGPQPHLCPKCIAKPAKNLKELEPQ